MESREKIGFIGQGFVGKNYAEDFKKRGYPIVQYSLEDEYIGNKEAIKDCDIVFIAVPTPTTQEGFDFSIVEESIALVGVGKIAVIKSTVLPGTTQLLQKKYPDRTILFAPEFLCTVSAAHDAAHPFSNIVGTPVDSDMHRNAVDIFHKVSPKSPHKLTCTSAEAELMKYSHNIVGYAQVVFYNMLYDVAGKFDASWEKISEGLGVDPYIAKAYIHPVHKNGRGAGGNCFIKDFAAFRLLYEEKMPKDMLGIDAIKAIEQKNIDLLQKSEKDIELLKGVYGNIE